MKISADTTKGPLLSAGYPQTAGIYDEMSAAPGVLRPHWDEFINRCPRWAIRNWLAAGKRPGSGFGKMASPIMSTAIRWAWIGRGIWTRFR